MQLEHLISTAVNQTIERLSTDELFQLATDSYQQIRESNCVAAA